MVIMLEVKQGQVWEIYSPLATNWSRAKVVEVVNGRARLRYQLVPDQVTCDASEMTRHPEKYRLVTDA